MCSLFFHPLLYLVDLAFSISSHFTFLVIFNTTWPRFVLNSTRPHFELCELLQWGEFFSALSPLKELTQFEMRPCAVQNKSRPCCVEDDEESETRDIIILRFATLMSAYI